MYLPLWIIIGKSMMPPPKWIAGKGDGGCEGGTSRGCYVLAVDVGCGVGLGWNIGED